MRRGRRAARVRGACLERVRIGERVSYYWNLNIKDRRSGTLSKQRLIALVVRMSDKSYASSQQLGSSGLDENGITG